VKLRVIASDRWRKARSTVCGNLWYKEEQGGHIQKARANEGNHIGVPPEGKTLINKSLTTLPGRRQFLAPLYKSVAGRKPNMRGSHIRQDLEKAFILFHLPLGQQVGGNGHASSCSSAIGQGDGHATRVCSFHASRSFRGVIQVLQRLREVSLTAHVGKGKDSAVRGKGSRSKGFGKTGFEARIESSLGLRETVRETVEEIAG